MALTALALAFASGKPSAAHAAKASQTCTATVSGSSFAESNRATGTPIVRAARTSTWAAVRSSRSLKLR
eukprot:9694130-Lingulodinium_polyedra.AAC.1